MDTLRLAIGYITFLSDLVKNGGSNGGDSSRSTGLNFTSSRYCCPLPPPRPKKVLVKSTLDSDHEAMHSLTWESEENNRPGVLQHGSHVLVAKVWTPEDPRDHQQHQQSKNRDFMDSSHCHLQHLSN